MSQQGKEGGRDVITVACKSNTRSLCIDKNKLSGIIIKLLFLCKRKVERFVQFEIGGKLHKSLSIKEIHYPICCALYHVHLETHQRYGEIPSPSNISPDSLQICQNLRETMLHKESKPFYPPHLNPRNRT
ncbi:hypothetical protein EUGRSUZ_H05044 [Eucalyptus grandis]|uniref:Uncharacterized protein n=2 Tax=Eucalyptus grandis TaxID=71139 RepID=A0ACC3JYS9_EUCGR|nr:hypothetical protein EUGRSUZ_H05044 [Eucalyptus grandis]